jgi:glycosyltransferase involved in cell wall biosynthesis
VRRTELMIEPASPLSIVPPSDRPRLKHRLLIVSSVVAPTPYAGAFVAKGMLSQFDESEVVLAAERTWANPLNQTHVNGHRVYFVGARWNWPRRGQRFFAWLRWLFVPCLVRRLAKIARDGNCRAILATFPDDHVLFAAGLAARWLKVPFFPYFHNTYRENRHGVSGVLAAGVQSFVLRQAAATFVISEGMKAELEAIYPGRQFKLLGHTFSEHIPLFEPLPEVDPQHVRIGHLGNVNHSNLDALRRFCHLVNSSPEWSMNVFSSASEQFMRKERLSGERIHFEQPRDDELLSKLRANDILFLPHGLTGGLAPIEYRTIFPTRTIPYLLSGRPILAHSPKDSFLTEWLRRHNCAEIVDVPDEAELRAAVDRLCYDAERREQLVRNALEAAKQFHAPRVVDALKRTINEFSHR